MANITLFICTSENNKVLKNLDIEAAKLYEGFFRSEISVINPVFTIENSVDDLSHFNYCYISDFNRFYFITNVKLIRTGVWEFTCRCDVLYTYSNEILSLDVVLERQQVEYNAYINDERYKQVNYPRIQTKQFPNGFSKDFTLVLVTAGNGELDIPTAQGGLN